MFGTVQERANLLWL